MDSVFLLKFIKFCIVGSTGVFVDFGVTYILKEKVKLNKYVANSMGFLLAATSNFILNRIWTFQSNNPQVGQQYLRFVLISIAGLLLNTMMIWLLNGKIHVKFHRLVMRLNSGIDNDKVDFYVSKLVAVFFVTIWNFFMNYFFNF